MNPLTLASLTLVACANLVPPHEPGFVWIAPSTFDMGCTPGQSSCWDDETEHPVTLTHGFLVAATEVTQAQFENRMRYDPAYFTTCDTYGEDCPVEWVSWHESAAYANAESEAAGLQQCYSCTGIGPSVECESASNPYDCQGYRLLTEAEWEAAARCGHDTVYAGSNEITEVGWIDWNSGAMTHVVAELAPNDCGIYDMSGNVWEWTQDWYEPYDLSDPRWAPETDPDGATSGTVRVFRGGGWMHDATYARISNRFNDIPERTSSGIGFRIGRSAD